MLSIRFVENNQLRFKSLIVILLAAVCADFASLARAAQAGQQASYECNALGYVRHWLVAGPARLPYDGPAGAENMMREKGVEAAIVTPPAAAAPGEASPLGEPWRFYDPGENFFVECTAFYHNLARLDYYAFTELESPREGVLKANLWAAGHADLWVNGAHVARYYSMRDPQAQEVSLKLKQGRNRVCVRLQCVGIRDTNMLFGLQLLEGAGEVRVAPPGPARDMAQIHDVLGWLWGITAEGRDALVSERPAPMEARVDVKGVDDATWRRGERRATYVPADAAQVTVTLGVAGQRLARMFEVPVNRKAGAEGDKNIERHRKNLLALIAAGKGGKGSLDVWQVLARRMLKLERTAAETAAIDEALKGIEARKDCSDFALSALFRMQMLGLSTPEENAKIRRVALGFRYWNDEPGTDAMCFTSENHALLFHTCQMIAGKMYPQEVFSNSRRTGAEQELIGVQRILKWLDTTEKNGYKEFLSSTYMPLTVGAMLNAIDFSGDQEIERRGAALTDRLLRDLATLAFDGVTVGPQGRVYRNVLYPRDSGTQALLSFGTPAALVSSHNWVVFLASAQKYRVPEGLEAIIAAPASKVYREDVVEIAVEKTPAFLLTSLQIPASFSGGKAKKTVGLQPGGKGYQQHLWHATLGRECHVFVNNPGGSFDQSAHRPGYWYGNTTLPRLAQKKGMLFAIFDLPETNPMPFTHAHWPSDAFERQEVRGHWAFGALGDGAIALWCSGELEKHNEVLTGRELRAMGRRTAWLCVCGSLKERGGFEGFVKYCEGLAPKFDEASYILNAGGENVAFK